MTKRKPGRRSIAATSTIWKVVGRDKLTRDDSTVGFLITRGSDIPSLVVFVPGEDSHSLSIASTIAARNGRATLAYDLRGRGPTDFPRFLFGMLLLPVDSNGHEKASEGHWAGGMFIGSRETGRLEGFQALTLDGIDLLRKKDRGRSEKPIAPKLASNKGKKVHTPKAAN